MCERCERMKKKRTTRTTKEKRNKAKLNVIMYLVIVRHTQQARGTHWLNSVRNN